jgi:asparagine synthase (glutamine-hydrolysing)
MGRSHYNGYPFAVFQSEKEVTVIEGAIYDKSDSRVKKELREISLSELSLNQLLDKIKEFVLSTHGEFLAVKYDKQRGRCLIFNDALGRLPFYYCSFPRRSSTIIIMSREVKFIIPFLEKPDFDITALAEYLLFGYPLGDRTLWKDIKRLPPATMLVINTQNKDFLSKRVLSWNLDPKSESNETISSLHEETGKLVNLFLSSLKDIAQKFSKDYAHIVSLSGGLDSRATLAGLREIGVNPAAFSYPSGENLIAKKIAQKLMVDYHIILPSFKILNEDYVKLTDGLLSIGLRPRISYFYGLREKIGNKAILYTGDGGDKTLSPLGFKFNISNVQELLSYIIETDHVFDLDDISSMLNLHKENFREHLKNYLITYPEKTMEGKFAHFKVFERGFKWLFVGEDRNRFFLWSTSPFYSVRFFRASMKRSQRVKEHYMLYKNFLLSLNPVMSRIQYYDRLIPLSIPNVLLKLYLTAFEWLKTHFYELGTANPINLLIGEPPQEMSDETKKLILQLLGQKDIFNFLNSSRVGETIIKEKNQTRLNILATLILHASLVKSSHNS